MKRPPGKSRAELDADYKELMKKVGDDVRVFEAYHRRHRTPDRTDTFMWGVVFGWASFLIIYLLRGN